MYLCPSCFMDWMMISLADAVVEQEQPLRTAALAMLIHAAPRRLRVDNTFSDEIEGTANSIVAGCASATSLARGLLLPGIRENAALFPRVRTGQLCLGEALLPGTDDPRESKFTESQGISIQRISIQRNS